MVNEGKVSFLRLFLISFDALIRSLVFAGCSITPNLSSVSTLQEEKEEDGRRRPRRRERD